MSMIKPNTPEKRMIPIADSGNQGGIRMWPSEEWASRLYDLANVALVIGLIVGAISTVLVVWMGNIKEEYLRKDLASANERAANLEHETEELRSRNLELEKSLAPRRIPV